MKNFIVIIDGPMGSGKSTVGELIHKQLKRTALLNMDRIKWFISDFRRSKKDNAITNAVMLKMCDEYLTHGINLIISQGFWKEKRLIAPFVALAKKHKAKIYIYQLDAPRNILLQRIKNRKLSKDVRTSIAKSRVARNIRTWKRNRYEIGRLIETDKLSARKIAQDILSEVRRKT